MDPSSTPRPGREERLDEIVADYLRAAAEGRAPGRETLLRRHPDLAPDLAAFLDDRERFDNMAAPLRSFAAGPALPRGPVGGYEVVEEIARGGMGVVYKARQTRLNRTVALKMLREGILAGPRQVRRFQAEAEAVAALDHPGIVPVYEVGEHAGQPFLVMKYVEGGSLAGRLGRYQRDPRAAARLLADVADAVHHAHRHGVLHRDLKPANILLDRGGRPHVTDFGLAKRVSAIDTGTGAARLTVTGDIVGTPSYMAPEQARGEPRAVTVATDVYGLGAILYELLTGRPPLRGGGLVETLRLILEKEPEPPRRLRPAVDPDLEAICLKALQKEPARRYPSVQALADDLRGFLGGEPVQARPLGPVRRAWRRARRQPALAALVLALAAALAGGFAAVTWQWRRAEGLSRQAEQNLARVEEERQRAEANLRQAEENYRQSQDNFRQAEENFRQAHEAVDEFCVRLGSDRLAAVPGSQTVRRELLEAALKYYEQFLARRGNDPALTAEMAGIHRRLGMINTSVGRRKDALAGLERSREILETQVPDSPGRQRELARTYLALALLQSSSGQPDAALASYAEAEKCFTAASAASPDELKDESDLAALFGNKGLLCARLGRLDDARACYEKQIERLSRVAERNHDRPDVVSNLAAGYINLGALLTDIGRREEAIASFQRARDVLPHDDGGGVKNDRLANTLAICLLNLGTGQFTSGHADEGLATLGEARTLLEKVVKNNPDVLQYSRDLATCLRQTAHLHQSAGRTAEAVNCLNNAKELMENLVRRDGAAGDYKNELAKCLFDLGVVQSAAGKAKEALTNFEQAAEIRRRLVAAEPNNLFYQSDLGLTLSNIAASLGRLGRIAEGREAVREAVEHSRAAYERAPQVSSFRKFLAATYSREAEMDLAAGDAAAAVAAARQSRDLATGDGGRLYTCGGCFARAAALAAKKGAGSETNVREYESLALGTLEQALHAGFKDAEKMRKDPSFEGLRKQPQFEKLLAACGK